MNKIIYLVVFILIVLFSYWAKNQMHINIFRSFSLSRFFPFDKLQSARVIIPSEKKGVIFFDSFESLTDRLNNWETIWEQKPGTVEHDYTQNFMDNSNCLVIVNNDKYGWAYDSVPLIEVEKNDRFKISGMMMKSSDNIDPNICLNTYNKNKRVIEWNFWRLSIDKTNEWISKEGDFIVPDSVYYIKLRLVGYREGISYFDDIKISKIN